MHGFNHSGLLECTKQGRMLREVVGHTVEGGERTSDMGRDCARA
jgi:hypothetical protein